MLIWSKIAIFMPHFEHFNTIPENNKYLKKY